MTIVLPPVEPDLLRLVDGADHQPDADREEFDLGDREANIAGDGKAFVEHAVENVDDAGGVMTAILSTYMRSPSSRQRERHLINAATLAPNPMRRKIGHLKIAAGESPKTRRLDKGRDHDTRRGQRQQRPSRIPLRGFSPFSSAFLSTPLFGRPCGVTPSPCGSAAGRWKAWEFHARRRD